MISIASRDAFGGFTIAALSTQNILVVVAVMINPSLIDRSVTINPSLIDRSVMINPSLIFNVFFQSKLLIYCIRFFISSGQKITFSIPVKT